VNSSAFPGMTVDESRNALLTRAIRRGLLLILRAGPWPRAPQRSPLPPGAADGPWDSASPVDSRLPLRRQGVLMIPIQGQLLVSPIETPKRVFPYAKTYFVSRL